jgi:colanic acid biosynthesis glycosyl transferase WcaI
MSRHVVLVHRYFHPDTPAYAAILREIALGLGAAGHRVTVLTCQPSYNLSVVSRAAARELLAPGVEVRRWPVLDDRRSTAKKVVNLMWFCLRLVAAFPRLGRVDTLMAASTPPIAVAKVARWLARARGAEFVYHHQDIYPEVALSGGQMSDGMVTKLLRRLDTATDRRADTVVVLSEDMARLIESRGVPADRVAVINNFDPWRLAAAVEEHESGQTAGPLRVAYAGNLGRFQNLDVVFAALRELKDDPGLEFHFVGDGPLRSRLEELVEHDPLPHVVVHGYLKPELLADMLRTEIDLGLVTLNTGVIRAAYPSKTMSYLRNGVPVLALVEAGTALVRQLEEYGAGWSADPARPASLPEQLRMLAHDRAAVAAGRANARRMYEQEFGQEIAMAKWRDTLGVSEPSAHHP